MVVLCTKSGPLFGYKTPILSSSISFPFLSHPPFLPAKHTRALLSMLRQVSRSLVGRASAASMRWSHPFSSDLPADTAEDSKFTDLWKKTNPNLDPPKTPISYMATRPPIPPTIPSKLTVNLVLPYDSVLSAKEVDMVIIPATTGQMDVLLGHVATVAELKLGVISVHDGNDVTKYFLSGGFAIVHANSIADIVAIEASPVDRIDLNLVHKGLAEFQQKQSSASFELEKVEAQIGVDVHSALNAALTGRKAQP